MGERKGSGVIGKVGLVAHYILLGMMFVCLVGLILGLHIEWLGAEEELFEDVALIALLVTVLQHEFKEGPTDEVCGEDIGGREVL